MTSVLVTVLAQAAPVPESGSTGILLGVSVALIALVVRMVARRKP